MKKNLLVVSTRKDEDKVEGSWCSLGSARIAVARPPVLVPEITSE
jgi:hypothetical protein